MRRVPLLLLAAAALAGEPVRLHTGFRFTEGPAADADGNVYFNDIPAETTWRSGVDGTLTPFREGSRRANGMMFRADGWLVACEGAGQVAAYSPDGKERRVLADRYEGKPFNAPNDLVIDREGGIWFTDPYFGPEKELPQGTYGVYYVAPGGEVARAVEGLPKPNGILLSPDEKTLYVVCSGSPDVRAFPVTEPGKIGAERVFCRLKQPEGRTDTGGDGLTCDTEGNLYITSRLGVQVWTPKGALVRLLEFPETPANATFGGRDGKTLYVTARTSVYTLRLDAKGHRFPAGKSTGAGED